MTNAVRGSQKKQNTKKKGLVSGLVWFSGLVTCCSPLFTIRYVMASVAIEDQPCIQAQSNSNAKHGDLYSSHAVLFSRGSECDGRLLHWCKVWTRLNGSASVIYLASVKAGVFPTASFISSTLVNSIILYDKYVRTNSEGQINVWWVSTAARSWIFLTFWNPKLMNWSVQKGHSSEE